MNDPDYSIFSESQALRFILTLRPKIHVRSKWNINFEYLKIYESGKMKIMKYAVVCRKDLEFIKVENLENFI